METFMSGSRRGWGCDSAALLDWFTRVLPPMLPGHAQHVVFTSPYVLLAPDETAWNLYFERIAAKDPKRPRIEVLGRHFKGGPSRRYWPEFVFEGYVNHRPGAIYLKGLPDVAARRPRVVRG